MQIGESAIHLVLARWHTSHERTPDGVCESPNVGSGAPRCPVRASLATGGGRVRMAENSDYDDCAGSECQQRDSK
jgi:hypothetical protein